MREKILGVNIDILNRQETVSKIVSWLKEKNFKETRLIVTAYSEFFVRATKDRKFRKVINSASLVTPDGISVLAASRYLKNSKNKSIFEKMLTGFSTGLDILAGSLGDTVTGVWLFEEMCYLAEKNKWKVFLLGGWGDVASRTAEMLVKRFPGIIVTSDSGEKKVGTDEKRNLEVIEKINDFKPDILCVAYNPVVQEKWIYNNRHVLKARMAIGLGGTFNEVLGDFKKAPKWMERMGLKWLWRLFQEPKRFRRIMRAVIVFPWLVFQESIKNR